MNDTRLTWPRGVARYMALADWIAERIEEGQYAVGATLPTEAEICSRHDVSRYTTRQAIQELKRRGLVQSRQGRGTFVVHAVPTTGKFRLSFDSVDEFLGSGKALSLRIVESSIQRVDERVAALLETDPGDSYLYVAGSRSTEDAAQIFCWSEYFVPSAYAEIQDAVGTALFSELIEQRYRVSTGLIHQTIEAIRLDNTCAERLGVAGGSPGLLLCRTYRDDRHQVILHARNLHGGQNAVLQMDIRRGRD